MQSKNSSIIKDALALFAITLIAAICLGFVSELTAGPIADRKAQEKAQAYQAIYPEANKVDAELEELKAKVEAAPELLGSSYSLSKIDEACVAYDNNGKAIGYVMTLTSKAGYGGDITFTMGFTAEGKVTAIEILSISETAGLGMRATEPEFKGQFSDKKVEKFNLVKGGASADNDIDAISGATITSTAVTDTVNAGVIFATDLLNNGIGGVSHE